MRVYDDPENNVPDEVLGGNKYVVGPPSSGLTIEWMESLRQEILGFVVRQLGAGSVSDNEQLEKAVYRAIASFTTAQFRTRAQAQQAVTDDLLQNGDYLYIREDEGATPAGSSWLYVVANGVIDFDNGVRTSGAAGVLYDNGLSIQQYLPTRSIHALLTASYLKIDGLQIDVAAFFAGSGAFALNDPSIYGGGRLQYRADCPKSLANGVTIFDDDNIGTLTATTLGNFHDGRQGSGTGDGCWVRLNPAPIRASWAGVRYYDSSVRADNTAAINAINSAMDDNGNSVIFEGLAYHSGFSINKPCTLTSIKNGNAYVDQPGAFSQGAVGLSGTGTILIDGTTAGGGQGNNTIAPLKHAMLYGLDIEHTGSTGTAIESRDAIFTTIDRCRVIGYGDALFRSTGFSFEPILRDNLFDAFKSGVRVLEFLHEGNRFDITGLNKIKCHGDAASNATKIYAENGALERALITGVDGGPESAGVLPIHLRITPDYEFISTSARARATIRDCGIENNSDEVGITFIKLEGVSGSSGNDGLISANVEMGTFRQCGPGQTGVQIIRGLNVSVNSPQMHGNGNYVDIDSESFYTRVIGLPKNTVIDNGKDSLIIDNLNRLYTRQWIEHQVAPSQPITLNATANVYGPLDTIDEVDDDYGQFIGGQLRASVSGVGSSETITVVYRVFFRGGETSDGLFTFAENGSSGDELSRQFNNSLNIAPEPYLVRMQAKSSVASSSASVSAFSRTRVF